MTRKSFDLIRRRWDEEFTHCPRIELDELRATDIILNNKKDDMSYVSEIYICIYIERNWRQNSSLQSTRYHWWTCHYIFVSLRMRQHVENNITFIIRITTSCRIHLRSIFRVVTRVHSMLLRSIGHWYFLRKCMFLILSIISSILSSLSNGTWYHCEIKYVHDLSIRSSNCIDE